MLPDPRSGRDLRCRGHAPITSQYTRWFNDWALLLGWAAGMFAGTAMAVAVNLTLTYPFALGGYTFPGYTALYAGLCA